MSEKVHTTNYYNAFIEVAEDCPIKAAEIPPQKGNEKTIASLEYEILIKEPYKYTSDEILFHMFAVKHNLPKEELENEKQKFFSKGQPCFRCSPLAKRYGWGIHSNSKGKIAIYAMESDEYKQFLKDKKIQHLKAMRSRRS